MNVFYYILNIQKLAVFTSLVFYHKARASKPMETHKYDYYPIISAAHVRM